MFAISRIQKAFDTAKELPIDKNSKLVLVSDCHRGIGSAADNFAKNQNIYHAALNHYLREGFTYIELGDGDELWENRRFPMIVQEHRQIFELLSQFHKSGKMYMIYGNHDMYKKNPEWVTRYMESSFGIGGSKSECWNIGAAHAAEDAGPLFPGIKTYDGLVLHDTASGHKFLLIHGHQADFFNFKMWRLARFLVRYFWRPLELIGVQNPFDTPRRPGRRSMVERFLIGWCKRQDTALIAGHTHRPVFPKTGEPPYYNTGSCVKRQHITCLEIERNCISLVRWSTQPREDNVLYVKRDVLDSGRV